MSKHIELRFLAVISILLLNVTVLSAQEETELDTTYQDSSAQLEKLMADSVKNMDETEKDDEESDGPLIEDSSQQREGTALFAVNAKKTKFAYFDTTQSIDRVLQNNAFDVGEKLTFIIRYGPIVAGSATMGIPNTKRIRGYECFHIVSEARSSKFFSTFFKVRDKVESYMDKDGIFSWRFEKHLREGNYRSDQYVDYDYFNQIAVTDKKDTLKIPRCIQDILSAFYYVRLLPLEVGKSIYIDNHTDRKLYPLEVKVLGKERVTVKAGTFDCIVIEPVLRSDAIFKQRGRLTIWLTDDSRRVPVQMKSKIIIGSITAELKSAKGTKKSK
ncbi:DUF3108 domain-containing protein [candidate division KSB1 bacterium]|nr:DUF3108 domain-containing protein [candidate division KSB1 bacterium]